MLTPSAIAGCPKKPASDQTEAGPLQEERGIMQGGKEGYAGREEELCREVGIWREVRLCRKERKRQGEGEIVSRKVI